MQKPIIWKEKLTIVCRGCSDRIAYEPPFDLNGYINDLGIFSKEHAKCKQAKTNPTSQD